MTDLLADFLIGIAAVVLVGSFLDHRKSRWTGRRTTTPLTSPPPPRELKATLGSARVERGPGGRFRRVL